MVTLTQLEYLLAVDRFRHFGKAAKASFITQPTLSMQIQRLEEELGVEVFDRSKKPILPTESGKKVIEQARVAVAEFKKLQAVATQGKETLSGPYTLAVIPTLSPYLIPLFIGAFAQKYPQVELTVEELQTSQILEALANDTIDAALLATPLREPGVREEVLFNEPFYLYVAKDHPLARKPKIKESELDGHDVWLLKEGHCLRNQIVRLCTLGDKACVFQNVHFESGNLETVMSLVDRNGGYTLLPTLALRHHEKAGNARAKVLAFQEPVPAREISLVLSRRSLKRPIHDALKAAIHESVPRELLTPKQKLQRVAIG